jgi:TonB family protein
MKSIFHIFSALFLATIAGCETTKDTQAKPPETYIPDPIASNFEATMARVPPPNEFDSLPIPISRKEPYYPSQLKGSGTVGEVIVSFIVLENGRPNFIRIVQTNHTAFEESVIRAVREWVFTPAMSRGDAVPCFVQLSITITSAAEAANKPSQATPVIAPR